MRSVVVGRQGLHSQELLDKGLDNGLDNGLYNGRVLLSTPEPSARPARMLMKAKVSMLITSPPVPDV